MTEPPDHDPLPFHLRASSIAINTLGVSMLWLSIVAWWAGDPNSPLNWHPVWAVVNHMAGAFGLVLVSWLLIERRNVLAQRRSPGRI